jgi:diguanylate cyclase (GGDEF)-like protein
MPGSRLIFSPPHSRVLRWLTDPGSAVPARVRPVLFAELFSAPRGYIVGLVNGLALSVAAVFLGNSPLFVALLVADAAIVAFRIWVPRHAIRLARVGRATPTDLYLLTVATWCGLQGLKACAAMLSGVLPLQILAVTTVMAFIGPICARNYAVPRYAILLAALCHLPLVAGAALSGDPWLLILIAQTPLFLTGILIITRRFQTLAVEALVAEQDGRHAARHDALTGLLNRFGMMEVLQQKAPPGDHRAVLFYLDLDGFKPINDTFGHHAGDRVLQGVADRLREAARSGDRISRLGGDEFVIFAHGVSPAEAAVMAERIIGAVSGAPFGIDGGGAVEVGISIGFACAPEDGASGDELHRKADAALYEAKAAGRGGHRRFSAPANDATPLAAPAAAACAPAMLDAGLARP